MLTTNFMSWRRDGTARRRRRRSMDSPRWDQWEKYYTYMHNNCVLDLYVIHILLPALLLFLLTEFTIRVPKYQQQQIPCHLHTLDYALFYDFLQGLQAVSGLQNCVLSRILLHSWIHFPKREKIWFPKWIFSLIFAHWSLHAATTAI